MAALGLIEDSHLQENRHYMNNTMCSNVNDEGDREGEYNKSI